MKYIVQQAPKPSRGFRPLGQGRFLTGFHTDQKPPTPIWGRRRHALLIDDPTDARFNRPEFTGIKFIPQDLEAKYESARQDMAGALRKSFQEPQEVA